MMAKSLPAGKQITLLNKPILIDFTIGFFMQLFYNVLIIKYISNR